MMNVRRSGMKTSVSLMSWLPVPRIPSVCHVSTISASAAGKKTMTSTG